MQPIYKKAMAIPFLHDQPLLLLACPQCLYYLASRVACATDNKNNDNVTIL